MKRYKISLEPHRNNISVDFDKGNSSSYVKKTKPGPGTQPLVNNCDICSVLMIDTHYCVRIYDTNRYPRWSKTQNWVCSKKCFNMWIFQHL